MKSKLYACYSAKRFTKTFCFFILLSFLGFVTTLQAQCALYPVSLSDALNNSSLVAEGKVIAKKSFWNPAGNYIYTSNLVSLSRVMKGSNNSTTIEIITEGGELEFKKQTVEPSLQLGIGEEGVFTLNAFDNSSSQFGFATFRTYADQQGFIKYDAIDGSAHTPFRNYTNIDTDLYPKLQRALGIVLPSYSGSGKGYNPSSISSITGMSPLNITAGTFSVLTISGSGFGTTQSTSVVEFSNADDGGATFIQPDASQYVSWTNTQIQVIVPTRSGLSTGTAGTGLVRVTVAGSSTLSTQTLTVDYGELNLYYSTTSKVYNTRHVDLNGSNGNTWQMYSSFDSNTSAKAAFVRALQTWRCATHINWIVGSVTNTNVIALDGINVVRFDIGSELPNGVLGRCTSYFSGCTTGTLVNWFVSELDICFDDPSTSSITWQFGPTAASGSQYDFESCALHELGHGHQLSHVINSNDVMHYALSNAQNNRNLITQNINAGNDVMSRNTSVSVCGYSVMTALNSTNCVLSAPVASFVLSPSVCVGQTLSLSDLSSFNPGSRSWTIAGVSTSVSTLQNPSFVFTAAGIYSVSLEATNNIGTSAVLTKTITVIALPTIAVSQSTLCSGSSTLVTASGAANYTWSPGALTGSVQTLNPASTTIYTIQGSNGACIGSFTSTLTVISTPTIVAANSSLCAGSSRTLTASGAISYTWSPGGLTGSVQILNPSSTTVYTITGNNANCSGSSTLQVTVYSLPILFSIVNPTSICAGSSSTLTAAGASSYTWDTGIPNFTLSGFSLLVSPTISTTYTGTASDGTCINTTTVYLDVLPSPTISAVASPSSICVGQSCTLTASGSTTYTWSSSSASTFTGSSIVDSPSLSTSYNISSSLGNCTRTLNLIVVVHSGPTVNMSVWPGTLICAGAPATLQVNGTGSTYSWMPGGATGNSVVVSPAQVTSYSVTASYTTNGCSSNAVETLSVLSTPVLTISSTPATLCEGSTATLNASGATSYTWFPGGNTGAAIEALVLPAAIYTVSGSSNGCPPVITVFTLTSNPLPTLSVSYNDITCIGESQEIIPNGALNYTYEPGNFTGPSLPLTPTISTNYTITGESLGCISKLEDVFVEVSLCEGVYSADFTNDFTVYPNPTNDRITVDFGKSFSGKITLVTALGQLLEEREIQESNKLDFVLENYPQGVYFLKVNYGNNNCAVIKLIKN